MGSSKSKQQGLGGYGASYDPNYGLDYYGGAYDPYAGARKYSIDVCWFLYTLYNLFVQLPEEQQVDILVLYTQPVDTDQLVLEEYHLVSAVMVVMVVLEVALAAVLAVVFHPKFVSSLFLKAVLGMSTSIRIRDNIY